MIDFKINSNIKEFDKKLTRFQKKQLPFASSRAINDTLKEGRKAAVNHLRATQKSRKPWWNNKATGLNIKFSNKKRLLGRIFTNIYWAKYQEYGGIKIPKGNHILVPTEKVPKYARKAGGHKQLFEKSNILHHNGSPIIELKSGKKGILRRRGKGKTERIEMLYGVVEMARIKKPMLGLRKTMRKVVKRRFRKNLIRRINDALKSTKK